MISRLTASAALFAVLATAGLGFAAEAQQRPAREAGRRPPHRPRRSRCPPSSSPASASPAPPEPRPARCRPAPGAGKACTIQRRTVCSHRRPPGKPIVCRGA